MTIEITNQLLLHMVAILLSGRIALTDERQPQELQPHQSQDSHDHPQNRLDVERKPEEPAVCCVDRLGSWLAALKHPFGVAGLGVDLIPPAKADEAAASDVLEVVEVGGEEENSDDEDHDPGREPLVCAHTGAGRRRQLTCC